MTKLYVGGVRGVGKTSACLELKRRHPDIVYVSDSEMMMRVLGVRNRDELWETPKEVEIEARLEAHKIFDRDEDMLVDGHFVLLPEDLVRFDAFVLIDADTGVISRLREEDGTRRRQTSQGEIEKEKEALRKRVGLLEGEVFTKIVNDGTIKDLSNNLESVWFGLKERR